MAKTIITAALPYANGLIHIGHIIEYVQADIYARFLRLIGEEVLFICASDMHGTPIEVKAQQAGIKPKEFAKKYHLLNKAVFKKYGMSFDNYYHTDSKENKELASSFFNTLNQKGYIYKKDMKVVFCPNCGRNLPDRYVKGTCPNCGGYDQYGDVCENCGLTLKGTDLVNPRCAICQKVPIFQLSENYFFSLSKFASELTNWLSQTELQLEIKNSIQEWLTKGLEDWCISRDGPYFGFKIPGEKNKYFYVWLDAPIGYISSTKNLREDWEEYWKNSKIIHVIGKDIIYFHFLFWPAVLMGVGYKAPDDIIVHGFLTVNGQKMSKSRGTFFTAEDFLKYYPAEYLRFYYAQHLSKKLADIDLDFEVFKSTINNKLVANLANFSYRTLSFVQQNYQGKIILPQKNQEIETEFYRLVDKIKQDYLGFNYKEAVNDILRISDLGNAYFQKTEPWKNPKEYHRQISFCVNLVKNLAILIKPILPQFAEKLEKQLGTDELSWKDLNFNYIGKIKSPKILLTKIETVPQQAIFPLDLRVGKILEVKNHPQADSLYLLQVDFGSEKRQAVAGLRKHLEPEQLLNKKAVFCLNIKPAKLRGEESNCMILAAGDEQNVSILELNRSELGEEVNFEGYLNNKQQITFEDFKKLIMAVKDGNVFYQTKILKTAKEQIKVIGIKDKALVG